MYVACMFGNNISDAESIASLLKENNASQYLRLPRKAYVYDQYIPYKTKDQILKAKQEIASGDLAEALSILKGSLAIYDSHIAQRLIGTIYFENGDNQNAWNHFNRVYEEFRFDPDFLSNFIMLNISLDKIKQSKVLLDELKQIDPENGTIAMLSRLLSESE